MNLSGWKSWNARRELDIAGEEVPVSQRMFRAV